MKEEFIRSVPLFATLPASEIRFLADNLKSVEFEPNTLIAQEGDYGDRLFIILRGEIAVYKSLGTPDERLIAVRGPGNYIGEMALFEPEGLRTASVTAHTAVELLELTRADFDVLMHRQPELAYELVREMSNRLSLAHEATIRDLREKNRQLSQAYEELKAAQAQLIEKERLEKELAVARQIQESILPRRLPKFETLDVGARILPTRAVGGDLFDVIELGDEMLGLAVADVSDKGVPAAIFMALTRSLLRAEATRLCSPREVMENVNRVLLDMNDAGMFVTLLYGMLNGRTREFHYVRAGHELPLVNAPAGEFVEIEPRRGQPLGLFEEPALDEQKMILSAGSTLLVYTDGVTDQRNDRGEFFGGERLRDAACLYRHTSAQEMSDRLLETVNTFRGNGAQSDDITFLVVQVA